VGVAKARLLSKQNIFRGWYALIAISAYVHDVIMRSVFYHLEYRTLTRSHYKQLHSYVMARIAATLNSLAGDPFASGLPAEDQLALLDVISDYFTDRTEVENFNESDEDSDEGKLAQKLQIAR